MQTWLWVSELRRNGATAAPGGPHRPGQRALIHGALMTALGMSGPVQAGGPTGGQIAAGSGQISQSGNTTTIQQNSQTLSLSWLNFSIAANETVDFLQPGASSIAVNRILGSTPSDIFGHLNANGQVWLINPNGVLFGRDAQVNVGGLVASTLALNDSALDFNRPTFDGPGKGSIVNQGAITAPSGGYVALVGNQVSNRGVISARLGTVALAGGSAVTLTFNGNQLLHVQVDKSTLNNLAENRQLIVADGGQVLMSAGAKDAVMASLVNNTGVVQARAVENHSGTITLLGGMEAGAVNVGGKLDASAPNGGDGGSIETSAAHLNLAGNAQITAAAKTGTAGTWLVDPTDLTIDSTAAATISNTLNGGTNVTEQTTANGATGVGNQSSGAGDINVDAPISWSSASANLTLQAFHAVNVNASVTGAGSVTMDAAGSNLTIAAGASITGGAGVTLATAGNFINNGGSTAVATGTSSPWLIYSTNPTLDTAGGLTPAFIQYNATSATSPTGTGNGFLYSLAPRLSITGLTGSVTKVYDGATTATLTGTNLTTTGLINGNLISTATGSYASSNAGTGIGVTSPSSASAITVTDSTRSIPVYGYTLAGSPATANIGTITPALLTASIVGDPTKVYNDSTTATVSAANYSVTGFVTGQGAAVIPPGGVAYAGVDAGTQTLSATLTPANFAANSGTNLANYILPTSVSGPGTITPAQLLISGVLANNKVYDGTTSATLNVSGAALFGVLAPDIGLVSINQSAASTTFASPNVGNNIAVNVNGLSLAGPKAKDYSTAPSPAGLVADITPKALTVSGATANNKVYDATETATLSVSGAALSGLVPSDAGSVTLSSSGATGLFSQSDVGNNLAVTATGFGLTGSAAGNYAFSQPSGLLANITPAPLTIGVIGNPTKVYDGTTAVTLTAANIAFSGFVGGQGATVSQAGSASYATKNAAVGIGMTLGFSSSDLTPNAGTSLSNYTIASTATGTGTITPAPLAAAIIGNPTKTFDGNATAALTSSNYSLSGVVSNEGITVTQTVGTYDTPNAGVQNVTAILTAADYLAGTGTLLSNYILPTTITGAGTITKAALSGSLNAAITGNPTKVYDGTTIATLPPSDFTLSGFVGADSATVNQTITGQYGSKNAGQQPVSAILVEADFTAGPGTNLNNYTYPVNAFGSGTILPAPLTVSIINNPTKVYDGTSSAILTPPHFQITGFVAGEGALIHPTQSFTYAGSNAGPENITGGLTIGNYTADAGTLLSNYVLATTASGPGTITQAPLFITGIYASNKSYDTTLSDTLNVAAAALAGLVAADTGKVTLTTSTTGTFSQANVGTALPVTAGGFSISGSASANYTLQPLTNLAANITPALLTLSGVTANNKPYDATTVDTLNTSAAVLRGVLGSDSVTFSASSANAQFSSVNVGNNLTVTSGGFTISGVSASNYTLAQPGGLAANITPAAITAVITGSPTKLYDGTTTASLTAADFTLSGFAAGQGATVPQSSTSNYLTANVGTGLGVTATLVLSDFLANAGTNLSNYALPATAAGNLGVITARVLNLTGTRVYDSTTGASATLFGANGVLTGINGETLTLSGTGTLSTKNVGTQQPFATGGLSGFSLTGNGSTLASNYTFTGGTDWVTVTPATLTVSGATAANKIYDGSTAASVSGAALSGVLGSDSVALGNATTGTFATKNVGNGIPVSTAMTISGIDAGNYLIVQPSDVAANISRLAVTVGAAGQNKAYDGTTTAGVTLTSTGVIAGDNIGFTETSANFSTRNVGNNIAISVVGISGTGADAGNYTLLNTSASTQANITPAILNLTGTRVYDATAGAAATLFGSNGILTGVNGETLTLTGTGTLSTKNVGSQQPFAPNGLSGFTLTGNNGALVSNYIFAGGADWVTITPATLTVSGTVAASKTYDGTTAASLSGATLQGVLLSDNVALGSDTTGTFATRNVGNNIAVSTAMTVSGTDAGNYLIVQPSGLAANISPLGITVTATGVNKVYDGTTTATVILGSSGVVAGDNVSFTDTSAKFSTPNVGNSIPVAVLGVGDVGTDAGNYTLLNNATSTSADITPVILNLTSTRVYDATAGAAATLFGSGGVLTGVNGETLTLSGTGALSTKNVGTQQPFATNGLGSFTLTGNGPALAGNYTLAGGTDWVTVTPATLTVSGTVAANKVYDATTAASLSGATLQGVLLTDNVILGNDAIGSFSTKNAGNNVAVSTGMTIGGTDAGNYIIVQPSGLAANITPLAITVNATGQNKVYNANLVAAVTLSAPGVIAGDSLTFTDTAANFNTPNVGNGIPIAVTGISGSGADLGNYTFNTTASTSANITPAVLNLTGSRVYDATTGAAASLFGSGGVLTGVNGQTLTLSGSGTLSSKNAGTQQPFAANGLSGFTLTGNGTALASNYTFAGGADGVTITPLAITVNATGQNKVYDSTRTAVVSLSSGVLPGDSLSFTDTAAYFSTPNVGNGILIAVTGISGSGADLGNYTFNNTATTTNGNITPARLTVSGTTAANKVYDATTVASLSGATLVGVLGSDNVVLDSDTTGTFASKNVGNGIAVGTDMTVSGASAGNYMIVQPSGLTANITPLAITVSAIGQNRVYNGTTVAGVTLGATGVIAGDTLSFTDSSANFNSRNVGNNIPIAVLGIRGNGADAGNYIFNTSALTEANITPLAVTVIATGDNKTYDGNTAATVNLSSSGILPGDRVTFSEGTANFNTPNAGNGIPILVTGIAGGGAQAGDYTFNMSALTSANISPYVLSLTSARTYDGTPVAAASLFGNDGVLIGVNGETLTLTGSGTLSGKNVGTQVPFAIAGLRNFTLTGDGSALASNYTLSGGTDWVTINPALLNVTGTTTTNRDYDGTLNDTLSGSSLVGLFGRDVVILGNATTGTFDTKNAGTDKPITTAMTLGGADAGDYMLVQPNGLTANVTPLGIVVNATGTNRAYDGSTRDPVALSSAGVLPGDQVNFSSLSANFPDKNVGNAKDVLVTGISDSGASADNYVLLNNTATTTANITPLTILVNATGTNKVYDGNDSATVTLNSRGILPGDQLQFTYGSANFSDPDVGNNKPVTVTNISGSGADASDYAFNSSAATTADILSAPVGGPSLGRPGSGLGLLGTNILFSWLAQTQGVLGPQSIATPYGLADQNAIGIATGNREPKDSSMQRNRIPSDFHPRLGLVVIEGGVKLPADAGM